MGIFSFLSEKPATRIIKNLYLGDKNNVPADADYIMVCSKELLKQYKKRNNMNLSTNEEFIIAKHGKIAFARLQDWPKLKNINLETTIRILNWIDEKLAQNAKVYVHCMLGVNRSASHVFMYCVIKGYINQKKYKLAMKEFKEIYPGINPLFGWSKLLKIYFPYTQFLTNEIKANK
ncbi:dual specificity protein phosphatase [Spiroplasma endosymbiont of Labia minor]|uniref:dual specificity protein phosphatase family protein n=1 Tax=Spiroplasma endosymbiont of Labia minor TaxID=3066305 RepID=UPI0030D0B439